MREAQIFAFPSIRELGAGVLVEAMATAMPCAVVDYGAPGTLVSNERGVCIPLGSKDEIARDLAEALVSLVADREHAYALGQRARQHVLRSYTWEAKARKTLQVYEWALGRRDKPDFWESD
jgi:glycosyltransferase involved in cell wall biosynthesis